MFLQVKAGPVITLEDAHNFKAFKIVIDKTVPSNPSPSLTPAVTRIDGGAAWISQGWLRAQIKDDQAWQDGVTAMIGYAAKHGWVEEKSGDIRAHIESA